MILEGIVTTVAPTGEVNIAPIDKTLSGCGVTEDSSKRLIQFVGDGRRHFTHQRHTTQMRQLGAIALRIEFRLFARRDVDIDSQNSCRCFLSVKVHAAAR